jgi:hypothetical protein
METVGAIASPPGMGLSSTTAGGLEQGVELLGVMRYRMKAPARAGSGNVNVRRSSFSCRCR